MTTMASRACSTLEGHPEVNQRRDTQIVFLPLLDKTKFAATPLWLTRLEFLLCEEPLEYTMALQTTLPFRKMILRQYSPRENV